MDRRQFLQSATLVATAAGASGGEALAQAPAAAITAPRVRRFDQQRWILDNLIRANSIDWDQPRSVYLNAPCGMEAAADFAAIRARVQKMADIGPAFEATALRREAKAKTAEAEDDKVAARDNFFMAAIHWSAAQWPYDEDSEANLALNGKKRAAYAKYAALADHPVEAVAIPFAAKTIPGWLHLPYGYTSGRVPAVMSMPGMDGCKEGSVALYGDRFLARGIAVLAVDAPGEYEAIMRGLHVSMENWAMTGKVLYEFLARRPEIDGERIGIVGTSMGSFISTIAAAGEPRLKAVAVSGTCLEPGMHTIFEEASPTFKRRFMYMSGYTDEDEFDKFAKTLSWEGHAEKITAPYLCIAGEADELCPLPNTERMMKALGGPKQLVVYQDSRHSVGGVPAANLGPFPPSLQASWMAARLAGKPFASERWLVTANGQIIKTPL